MITGDILKMTHPESICKNHKKSCKCIRERIVHLDGTPCGGKKILVGKKEYTIISSLN